MLLWMPGLGIPHSTTHTTCWASHEEVLPPLSLSRGGGQLTPGNAPGSTVASTLSGLATTKSKEPAGGPTARATVDCQASPSLFSEAMCCGYTILLCQQPRTNRSLDLSRLKLHKAQGPALDWVWRDPTNPYASSCATGAVIDCVREPRLRGQGAHAVGTDRP